jgi:DNA-binding NtrC family response regulator
MAKTPKNPAEDSPDDMNEQLPAIMTKPLPVILDELESYIRRVEEAVRQARAAATDSRQAADEARKAGEAAASCAQQAAEAAVAQVRNEAARAAEMLGDRIFELSEKLDSLEDKVKQEVIALDDAFLSLKDRHTEQSPFFQG